MTATQMRLFTAILTIATILTCPYGCLVGSAGRGETGPTTVACCGHCCHLPLQQRDPEHRPDDGPNRTCLCRGAILGHAQVEFDPMVGNQLVEVSPALAAEAPCTSLAFEARDALWTQPHGDTLRIALCSLVR